MPSRPKRAALVLAALIAAAPATAQVAVTVASSDDDAAQRDLAAAVVTTVRGRWQMLTPQLQASSVKVCKTGDTACLRALAAQAHATHLLVVGVAPLGVRDHVVAVQLFDVTGAAPLFEESAVQPGALEQLQEVSALASRLIEVVGPPPFVPPKALVEPDASVSDALGTWAWAGFGLVSAAGATAGTSAIVGGLLVEQRDVVAARNVFFYGLVASGTLALAGTAAFIVDDM